MIQNFKELCCEKGKHRVLCLDYGDERIGCAVSDINWIIASPLKVIKSHGAFDDIFKIIEEHSIAIIVLGLPVALNGECNGTQLKKVYKFADKLDELALKRSKNIKITFFDERLSTSAAKKILLETETPKAKYKQQIDKIAASFVLQSFLDLINF